MSSAMFGSCRPSTGFAMPDPSGTHRQLTGWGRTAPSTALVVTPTTTDELIAAVAAAPARGVVARGLGRSYGDPAQNAGGLVVDLTRLSRIRAFDSGAGLVTVQAGCSLDALIDAVLPSGWLLPVTPGTRFVTVGGAVAADVHGKNHHRDGAFGRHVESLKLLTPGGDLLELDRSNRLPELEATLGGLGLTGIVVECTLRLRRVETSWLRVDTEPATSLDETIAKLEAADRGFHYSVAWVDGRAGGKAFGRGVLLLGEHAAPAELPAGARESPLERSKPRQLQVPTWASAARLIEGPALNAFNELRFRRTRPGTELQPLDPFFYPLDAASEWNRLYGRHGFVQYQFVVPFPAKDVLATLLERLRGVHPSLVVLKRFGEEAGPLAFPIPGWTAAVDIPAGAKGLAAALDSADELVASAGGRIYLAKDSRMRADLLPRMYPRLAEWAGVRARLDPDGRMQSDLARRLRLVAR
jgi:decaprenylphospho-beta-D-ribofuranose 2-oxidase